MMDETELGKDLPVNFGIRADFEICGQNFLAMVSKLNDDVVMKAAWINDNQEAFDLGRLMEHFSARLPSFFDWKIVIERCELSFYIQSKKAAFELEVQKYGFVNLNTHLENNVRAYEVTFHLDDFSILFASLPIVGRLVLPEDGLKLSNFGVKYEPGVSLTVYLNGGVCLGGRALDLPLQYTSDLSEPALTSRAGDEITDDSGDDMSMSSTEVKWFDVNKTVKAFTILRIGFAMQDSNIKLCFDARFTLAVLDLEVYELFATLSLDGDWTVGFGISGLMVTVDKPPVTIGGGLYKAPDETLYNGKLVLKFGKFALTALGSYGELEDGTASFFLYLMLEYPLGGPPCFYITGLAAGFGVNRSIKLPELDEVKSFPLVAAARGQTSSGLTSGTKPAAALSTLSNWIELSEGDYFISAGVQFVSFGMVKSFVLATVEFGNHLRISLLGISTISIPPNVQSGKSPVAYAELVIRAVISPEEGIFELVGCLTKESYILDRNCRLTGGFAFCMWTKGEYAGDFVITLGGCHHPLFVNVHYPVLDKVGVNWTISKGLTLVADGYFAITPNCLMAGARLELSYVDGSFRAWVRVSMELLIQWKPFFYDFRITASIGASFILIFKRVTVELGADLHLWGPDLSGTVTIRILCIDVTVRFGKPATEPKALNWKEFERDFLSDGTDDNSGGTDEGSRLCSVQISDGLISEDKDTGLFIVNPYRLKILTHSKMPATGIEDGKKGQLVSGAPAIGIVPMKVTTLTSTQVITVSRLDRSGNFLEDVTDAFNFDAQRESLSPALWGTKKPGINDPLIKNGLVGVRITPKEKAEPSGLPPNGGGYPMENLQRHEISSFKEVAWKRMEPPKGRNYSGKSAINEIQRTLTRNSGRQSVLSELERRFHSLRTPTIREIGDCPGLYMNAMPSLCTTGASPGK